jgi:hypothetical protein
MDDVRAVERRDKKCYLTLVFHCRSLPLAKPLMRLTGIAPTLPPNNCPRPVLDIAEAAAFTAETIDEVLRTTNRGVRVLVEELKPTFTTALPLRSLPMQTRVYFRSWKLMHNMGNCSIYRFVDSPQRSS